MTIITKTTAKSFFETGDFPSQSNFADFIDSCIFSQEASAQSIATLNITTKLSAVAANITTVSATNVNISNIVSANAIYATNIIATTVSAAVGGMLTGSLPNPALSLSQLTNFLSGDVSLNNASNFFDGPTVAQGTSGTWFASGTVTIRDNTGGATFAIKLWDGTTVIASTLVLTPLINNQGTASLSGYIASPAGNIRISVKDISSTNGKIVSNDGGSGKDSTISVFRIA